MFIKQWGRGNELPVDRQNNGDINIIWMLRDYPLLVHYLHPIT